MKLLIWDFDGTLAYRIDGGWIASLLEVLRHDVPWSLVTVEDLERHTRAGFPWHTPEVPHPHLSSPDAWWRALEPVFREAYEGVGFGSDQARAMAKRVRFAYQALERWRVYDDAVEALTALTQAGWTHVILSNHVPELVGIVEGLGLQEHFARIYNSALTGYEKPHPEAYRIVLSAFPEATERRMVGDNYRADVQGAEAAGIPAVLVHRSHPDARRYVATLSELPKLLSSSEE